MTEFEAKDLLRAAQCGQLSEDGPKGEEDMKKIKKARRFRPGSWCAARRGCACR